MSTPAQRVQEFLRQREMGRGNDPEVIANVWFDPTAAPCALTVSDLRAVLEQTGEYMESNWRNYDAR